MVLLLPFRVGKHLMRSTVGRTSTPIARPASEHVVDLEDLVVLVVGEVLAKEEWKHDKHNIAIDYVITDSFVYADYEN